MMQDDEYFYDVVKISKAEIKDAVQKVTGSRKVTEHECQSIVNSLGEIMIQNWDELLQKATDDYFYFHKREAVQ